MSELKENVQKCIVAYSEKTALRALVNAIPWVGGSIDVMLSNNAQKITEKRITLFLKTLSADLRQVDEKAIDKAYLETEDFFDLIRKAIEASIKTRDREKIKLYARIMCNALLHADDLKESAEDYLSALAELSLRELRLAKMIYEMQSGGMQSGENELEMATRTGWSNLSAKAEIPAKELDFLLKRIERTGLIKEITGGYLDYSGGVYIITSSFVSLMNYLEGGR